MLMQIIPSTNTGLYAVLAREDGKPEFREVVCMGCLEMQAGPDRVERVVSGYIALDHILAADFLPNFVGYAEMQDEAAWTQRCAEKRVQIAEAEEKRKQQKIIVPEKPGVQFVQ